MTGDRRFNLCLICTKNVIVVLIKEMSKEGLHCPSSGSISRLRKLKTIITYQEKKAVG